MQISTLLRLALTVALAGCSHPAATSPPPQTAAPAAAQPAAAQPEPSAKQEHFLAVVDVGELADLQRLLERDPALASARSPAGRSAVLLALARQPNKENFYAPASNPFLKPILAAHPALDAFETAAVGDAAALARLIAADPTLVTRVHRSGWTLLHFAAFGGNAPAVRLLLDHGAALEQTAANKFGNTPLHVALLTGDHATTQLLIERGANLAAHYEGGTTALHLAAELGRVDLLTLLLGHGAAINARLDDGTTALGIALRLKRSDAAELLRRRGAE